MSLLFLSFKRRLESFVFHLIYYNCVKIESKIPQYMFFYSVSHSNTKLLLKFHICFMVIITKTRMDNFAESIKTYVMPRIQRKNLENTKFSRFLFKIYKTKIIFPFEQLLLQQSFLLFFPFLHQLGILPYLKLYLHLRI